MLVAWGSRLCIGKRRQEMLNNAGHSAGGKIRDDVKNKVLVSTGVSSKTRSYVRQTLVELDREAQIKPQIGIS